MRAATLYVHGYLELVRAFDHSVDELGPAFRYQLKEVGEIVRQGAAARFYPYDSKSAKGYRVYVTQQHVNVGQSIKPTTGQHPEYGALQMRRALLPSLHANEANIRDGFEKVLDVVMVRNFMKTTL